LLFKTGLRRKEVRELDVTSVDLPNLTIRVRGTGKRSNEIIYFDDEMEALFKKWLKQREKMDTKGDTALFLNRSGKRLGLGSIDNLFRKYATATGLNNPKSKRIEDRLSPHCARHFFTTWMINENMSREILAQLRGDITGGTMGVYYHPTLKEMKDAYLARVPKFGLL